VVTEIAGLGTTEQRWRSWLDSREWTELVPPPGTALVVVAPHPDDEVLGVGGLAAAGRAGTVVAVTDGEASHPDSTVFTRDELAGLRRAETDESLCRLGLGLARVVRLGQPDGGIDEPAVAAALTDLLGPDQWCLATWRHDGHPDHEAVGRAAATACAATGARLLEYPVWMWHWAEPGDDRVPWARLLRYPLSPGLQAAKANAVAAFRTQVEALGPAPGDAEILPPTVLARFARPYEVLLG
jgi:LmbE family N-acetylglucosaminyl deacetylase